MIRFNGFITLFIVFLLCILVGCSNNKADPVDEWVEAFNFVSGKQDGLIGIMDAIKLPSEESVYDDIQSLREQLQKARDLKPPDMLNDLHGRFLAGIDLVEQGITALEKEDYRASLSSFESGLEIMYTAVDLMLERLKEQSPFEDK